MRRHAIRTDLGTSRCAIRTDLNESRRAIETDLGESWHAIWTDPSSHCRLAIFTYFFLHAIRMQLFCLNFDSG